MCGKILFHTVLTVFLLSSTTAESDKQNPQILKKCPLTEYKKFVECAGKLLRESQTEQEAAANIEKETEINCDKCTCQTCRAEDFALTSLTSCCRTCCPFVSCQTKHCCFKTCHSLCETPECKTSCRQSCLKFIIDQKSDQTSEHLSKTQVFNDDALNITTRINLTNVITNVNNISAPINLKSSNLNDFTIERRNSYQEVNRITNTPCCDIVSPTRCGRTSKFPFIQCAFNKTSHCGASCLKSQKFSRTPCDVANFGCGGLRNVYQIGYLTNNNKSIPNKKYNESLVKPPLNVSLPFEATRQLILPQTYFHQTIEPSFSYPPIYTNQFPRNYYNSYPVSFPLNPFFARSFPSPYVANPFYSSGMFNRRTPLYSPIYNNIQVPQVPFYQNIPNVLRYHPPTPYFPSGMQSFPNLQPQFNYALPNYQYQSPLITFPPFYTAFTPQQVVGEIMPNPTIDFKVRPPKNDAEILITNKVDEK